MVPLCLGGDNCGLPSLRWQLSSRTNAGRNSFAVVTDPDSDRAPHRGRHAARIGLWRHLARNFCFRGASQSSKKNPALESRDRATMVARPYLAHLPDSSAYSLAQRFSAGRSDDDVAHSPLRPCHGEWDLWACAPAYHAVLDEGAVASRNGLRTDPAYPLPALRRRGKNARLIQARSAEKTGCGRARTESCEGSNSRFRGDGVNKRRAE